MKCPNCGAETTRVLDSRNSNDKTYVKRRRVCEDCNYKFTTYEKIEETPLYIVKKDNRREKFDRNKLLNGLIRATIKRNISREELDTFVLEIEKYIQNSLKNEISSRELGELVMERLLEMDEVAYVRFVSVYKEFDDIKSFIELVEKISNRKGE